MRVTKLGIASAIIAMAGGLGSIVTSMSATATVDNVKGQQVNNQGVNQNKKQQNNNQVTPVRLTSSGNFQRFLSPVTKQKFKQNRRNELTKSKKKRNKQF